MVTRLALPNELKNEKGALSAGFVVLAGCLSAFYFQVWFVIIGLWGALVAPAIIARYRQGVGIAVYQIGIPILFATLALIVYDIFQENMHFVGRLQSSGADSLILSLFFQTVATLYAICIAFTLWRAMTDHDLLKSTLRDEATRIGALLSFINYFDNVDDNRTQSAINTIRNELADYVRHLEAHIKTGVGKGNAERLSKCIDLVEDLQTPEENDKVALNGIIDSLAKLTMIRSRRISLMQSKLSPYLLFILGFLSFVSLAMFYFLVSEDTFILYLIIPSLAFMYTFLLIMLVDLDRPFSGYWRINMDPFDEVLDRLAVIDCCGK